MGKILEKEDIQNIRQFGKNIVLAGGSFDIVHSGHIRFLEKCKKLGDVLIICLMSDKNIKNRKGLSRPIISEQERAEHLSHLNSVDFVYISNYSHLSSENLNLVSPDTVVYPIEINPTKEKMQSRLEFKDKLEKKYPNIKIIFLENQSDKTSSSKIIEKIKVNKGEEFNISEIPNRLIELKKNSTCALRKVGAIIVRDNRIIAEACNSSLDRKSCLKENCIRQILRETKEYGRGIRLELCRAIHAEQKAIANAASNGFSTKEAVMYCTCIPCVICSKLIILSGIKKVFYMEEYSNKEGLKALLENGIDVERFY